VNRLMSAPPVSLDYVTNLTQTAGKLALLALQNNPDCASLFESGGADVPNPLVVLAAIMGGTGYANIQYASMAPYDINPTTGSYKINNATTTPVLPVSANGTFPSATITINTSSLAPHNFSTTSLVADAVTLLHELGHVYEFLFGADSTAILDDQTSAATSGDNTTLVKSTCFPQ